MPKPPVVVWFRNDLRLADHKALTAAIATGAPLVLLYVLDDDTPGRWAMGGASRWWLAKSLQALMCDIEARGGRLTLRRGTAASAVAAVAEEAGATAVYFSRGYEPCAVATEKTLKAALDAKGVAVKRYGGGLLREPEDVRTKAGEVYKVYTPFWKALSAGYRAPAHVPAPKALTAHRGALRSDKLASWALLPSKPNWAKTFESEWQPGEAGANERLQTFVETALAGYAGNRNRPDVAGTSRLSPHLHFGEIAPSRCWASALAAASASCNADRGTETFLKELVWREFSYTLLFYWPDLPENPFRKDFARFPWTKNAAHLKAWEKGRTGYPIVDAGMRELWARGYMHNRVRMVVASFLIKHLMIPWQVGEAWFWDTLVDADLASNAASWQWVAGSGADAAPYFRIFNPITQGAKFDPDGLYVRRWVPELAKLPAPLIHAPWTAPAEILKSAGIVLGKTYCLPIVDHAAARARALQAYEAVKTAAAD